MIDPPEISAAVWHRQRRGELKHYLRSVAPLMFPKPPKVIVSDRGERWPNTAACATDLKVSPDWVNSTICRGVPCAGRRLKRVGKQRRRLKPNPFKGRPVVSDREEQWANAGMAASALGCTRKAIYWSIQYGHRCAGRWFRWAGEEAVQRSRPQLIPILRDDGVSYKSIAAIVGDDSNRRMRLHRAMKMGKPFEGHYYHKTGVEHGSDTRVPN